MRRRLRVALGALLLVLASAGELRAQTGGPVTVQAVDPATGATVSKVGNASDNSVRVVIPGNAGTTNGLVAVQSDPNSIWPFYVQVNANPGAVAQLQSSATANGNGTATGVDGYSALTVQLACTSCSGGTTVNWEAAGSDGVTYTSIFAHLVGTNTIASSTTTAGNTTWEVPVAGFSTFRARISNYSAGTISVAATKQTVGHSAQVVNANVIGTVPTNVTQLNGNTIVTGTGLSGLGVQRVVLATDQPTNTNPFAINWTTTAGNTIVTNTGTSTAATPRVTVAADGQKTMANSAPVVIASDQSAVSVSIQSNASVNVAQVNGATVSTAASGVQKVGVTGNAGAAMDAAGQNVASPANELLVGAQFNTTPTTITSGNVSPLQLDNAGNLLVNVKAGGAGGGPSDAAASAAASESDTARQKVTSAIRLYDTGQSAGSQLVTAKGDQTSGMWVNCKAGCGSAGDTTTGSTALGSNGATINVALAGERSAVFQLQSGGTGVYTVTPQCSADGGTTYPVNGYIVDPVSFATSLTATIASAQATTDYPVLCPGGSSTVQMKVTAYTSGTANWLARSTVNGPAAVVLGSDGTNARAIATTATGLVKVDVSGTAANGTAIKVDGSGVTQPVSGTVTTSPPANASTNVAQFGGTNVSTGTGAGGAGIPRVTISNDSSLAANQSVNVNQIAGASTSTVASGVQKVGTADSAGTAFLSAANALNSTGGGVQAVQIVAQYDDVSPTTITENQFGNLRMSTNRNAYFTIRDGAGNERGVNVTAGNALLVDGSNVNQPVTGTVTVQQATASNLNAQVQGVAASGTSKSGNPVQIGGVFNTTQPTVTTGQMVESQYTARGAAIVATGADTFNVTVNAALPTGSNTIGAVTQASGPWTENVTQYGGTNISTGTGASGAGIPRVTISNDSSLAANQSVNVNQFGGSAVVTGTGASGAGIPRVTIANDSNVLVTQSTSPWVENVSQFGGSNVATGTGGSGAGVPRVTVATDSGIRLADATSTTQYAAVSAQGRLQVDCANCGGIKVQTGGIVAPVLGFRMTGSLGQVLGDANPVRTFATNGPICDDPTRSESFTVSQTANAIVVAGKPGRRVVFCAYTVVGADAENLSWVEGTGSTCGTSTAAIVGGTTAAAGLNMAANGGVAAGDGMGWIVDSKVLGNDVCLLQSGSGRVAGSVKVAWIP